jgi:exopolysaccharide production protein ExoQ
MLPRTDFHPERSAPPLRAQSKDLHFSSRPRPVARASAKTLAIPLEDLACAALFAFFSMQGSIPGIAPSQALEITGAAPSALTTYGGIVSQALANGLILALLLRRPRLLVRQMLTLPCAALLGLLAVVSTAWSLAPMLTLRRSLPFALAGLFGLWFATRFPPERQRAILRFAFLALAVGTIVVVVFAPSIGLDHSPGHAADWQGVFTQKNACGRVMVLATAVMLFGDRITALRALSLALFLFVLVMSGSRGAWIVEIALLILWLALRLARCVSARARIAFAVAAPFALAASAAATLDLYPHFAGMFGRDLTLSGRTQIWAQVWHYIARRPLTGYGYDAFWRGLTGPSLQVDAAVHFIVEHAHNGFLEILLELGILGLALFLLSWIRAALRLWPLWRRGHLAGIAFPLAFLVLILLYSLDENTLLIYNGIFWPLYVAALASIRQLTISGDRHHAAAFRLREMLAPSAGGLAREEAESRPSP